MGSSFLLRNREGSVMGYVLAGNSGVLCRIRGAVEENRRLLLLDEDGEVSSFLLTEGESEQCVCSKGLTLAGACVCSGGKTLCATNCDAWRLGEREPQEESVTGEKESSEIPSGAAEALFVSQPRWPHPACWTGAEYRDGRWQ